MCVQIVNSLWKINTHFKCKLANIFLSIIVNICFGSSKEPSHPDGSFEYPQHIFGWEIRKLVFHTYRI